MRRFFKIYACSVKAHIASRLAYRADFFIGMAITIAGELLLPLLTALIYNAGTGFPGKMNNSHFALPREKLSRYVTRGKEYTGSDWLNEHILDSESGGGGLKSTVNDMTRFGQMFLNQGTLDGVRVLSAASIREMTTDHNAKIPPAQFDGEAYDSTWG